MAIAAGQYHSLALKENGTVVAWGQNTFRQTNVPPDLTNVVTGPMPPQQWRHRQPPLVGGLRPEYRVHRVADDSTHAPF
jgi:alpha-tubulin suppressor-like RCC1 family protein